MPSTIAKRCRCGGIFDMGEAEWAAHEELDCPRRDTFTRGVMAQNAMYERRTSLRRDGDALLHELAAGHSCSSCTGRWVE